MRKSLKLYLTAICASIYFVSVGSAIGQVVETGRLNFSDSHDLALLVDGSGNVFVSNNGLCIKYNNSFVQQWSVSIPNSPSSPWTLGFALDNQGNVIILNETEVTVTGLLYAVHPQITKIGSAGTLQWSQRFDNAPGYPDFSSYSRGPYNLWIDTQDNIYIHTQLKAKVPGNCWSDTYLQTALRAWLFSLAPSGSRRWDVTPDVPLSDLLNAYPRGATADGSYYLHNDIIGSNCWTSNANTDCLWQDSCIATHSYSLTHYSSTGVEQWNQTSPNYYDIMVAHVAPSGNYYSTPDMRHVLSKRDVTGAELWAVTAPEETIIAVVVSDDEENVLIRSRTHIDLGNDNSVTQTKDACYNSDGSLRWVTDPVLPNVLQDGIVNYIFDSENNKLYGITGGDSFMCIDLLTGQRLWTQNIGRASSLTRDERGSFYVLGDNGSPTYDRYLKRFELAGELTVLDANRDELTNTECVLIRVTSSGSSRIEDTLGIVTTDADGKILLTPIGADSVTVSLELGIDTLVVGDTLKVAKNIFSEPAVKHTLSMATMYSVQLDNGQFDDNGTLSFTEINGSSQEVTLDHSEFRYNLVVSIEWDASVAYNQSVARAFRNLSNYLYDVFDGQLRLDTVMIYDDQDHWLDADVRIHASNVLWPHAALAGVSHNALGDVVDLPRKWFGSVDESRNGTYDEPQPLDWNDPDNYRQLAHELGHYLLGFQEEYEFIDGNGQCVSVPNYGFMDNPYDNAGIYASEMSNNTMYAFADCRNTKQYNAYGVSCWDMFEIDFEKPYGTENIFVPIRRPDAVDISENVTPSGYNYIPGPNDNLGAPNYNVGALVQFPQSHSAPGGFTIEVVTHDFQMNRLGGIDVLLKNPSPGNSWVDIYQGQSSDVLPGGVQGGAIYILGAESGAQIQASSQYTMIGSPGPFSRAVANATNWLVAEATVTGPTGTIALTLTPIEGNYPLIFHPQISGDTIDISLAFENAFNVAPSLEISGSSQRHVFAQTGSGYSTQVTDTHNNSGLLTVWCEDASGAPYFLHAGYITYQSDSGLTGQLTGPNGEFSVQLDTTTAPQSALLLNSPYPVMRTGLAPDAAQVGATYSLSLDSSAVGAHQLTIKYSDADLLVGVDQSVAEHSLTVYRWNTLNANWVALESVADTANNVVNATITTSGVYALFTPDIITDVVDEDSRDGLPYNFQLAQNYPNPFNPATTISYSVPARSHVTITIYNLLGQRIRTLIDEDKSAGTYQAVWNSNDESGSTVASGVYLYRFETNNHSETRKMMLIK